MLLTAIVDLPTCRRSGAEPVGLACALGEAGVHRIVLRGKDDAEALARVARKLAPLRRSHALILHGDARLAASLDLDGVHLPSGASACQARQVLGADRLVGVSTHRAEELLAADACADYVTLSPVFLTASKPGYGPALGVARFGALAAQVACEVHALAGIQPGHVASLSAAGAAGVFVMGPLCHPEGPARARAYLQAIRSLRAS